MEVAAVVAFPERLSRFTFGRRIEELSYNIEGSLKMKADNFQLLYTATHKSTDVSDT